MLKKLMKYDLIWINKFMLIYFSITFILSILTRITSFFTDSFVFNIIYFILKGCVISAFASCVINVIIRTWVRFKNNTYKDESYLTNTLPISKVTLYNSKILSGIVSLLITILVILICFVIAFFNKDIIEYIKNIFGNSDMSFIVIGLLLTAILEFNYMFFVGIIGIIFGHKSNNNRVLKSVIIGIIMYFILQSILLLIIYLLGLINVDMNILFTEVSLETLNPLKKLVVIVNIIYLLVLIILYIVGKKEYNKGINVE